MKKLLVLWLAFFGLAALSIRAGLPYGLTERPAVGGFLDGVLPAAAPAVTGNWSATSAFPNLRFTNALGFTFVPGTTKVVVWEREGRVWSFENTPTATAKTLVLNISDHCQGWDDSGLLGLAFHPGFATNRYVFLYYTWVTPGTVVGSPTVRPTEYVPGKYHDRLSRFTLDASGVAVPNSELVFVDQTADSVWHNGGGLFFHPDNGFLYWTDGDDERAPTQIINQNLLSGVFRIDVDQRGGSVSHPIPRQPANGRTANYYIPNSNPFVGQAGVLEEFYALGLRSPHRMTFDPPSGRIFIGDVGASSREEVDLIEPSDAAGQNFQWSRIEGLNGDLTPPYIGVNHRPIIDYGHDEGQAVIGGYVYRGQEFAADLGGRYIFGDNVQGKVWVLDETTVPATKKLLCVLPKGAGPNSGSDYTGLSSFGLDAANELYLCQMSSQGGQIFRLRRTGAPPVMRDFPPLLSQTGAFSDTAALATAPALLPYQVNSPLWSDAAVKSRWMVIPTNTTISFTPTGEWTFPAGSVWVKHFELVVDEANAATPRRRLETRLLVRDTNGTVFGATYKWRPDNTEADLLTNKLDEDILIQTAGGSRVQTWHYPSRGECLACHSVAAKGVLGVKTRQSNRDNIFANGVTDNQLRAWNHVGLFSPALQEADIAGYTHMTSVTNLAADLETRVRSYLDANCAHCHRPGGVPAFWDARFDTPLASAGIVNGAVAQTLGIAGAKVAVPGHPEKSIMLQRASSQDPMIKMPPLARNVVDTVAVSALMEWISTLSTIPDSVPQPWLHQDIGAVATPGDATYVGGTLTVSASGDDIWNNADAFHYVYQSIDGDGELVARVNTLANTDPWAKAGVMLRESLDPGARHAIIAVTIGNGTAFQRRVTAGGTSDHTAGPAAVAPYWVRLTRAGSTVTSYVSPNGTIWTQVDTLTLALPTRALIGLALTAHNNSAVNTATLDHVRASATLAPLNSPPVVALTAPTKGAMLISPGSVALKASASDGDGSVTKVEFFDGPTKLGESAAPPYALVWSSPEPGAHNLSARATDDLGAVTTSASVIVSAIALTLEPQAIAIVNGTPGFTFRGQDGSTYVIEASSDFQLWTPVSTNAVVSGQVQFTDPSPAPDWRFYRVRLSP